MSDQNISALPRKPDWLMSEPDLLPRSGTQRRREGAARGAPPGVRADARPGVPRTHPSGYEQILAARAAMRADVERAAAAERRTFAFSPAPAPARPRSKQKPPRRRSRLFAYGLVAAPVCAALAGLAWVEPVPTSPAARVAAPAAAPTPAAPLLAVSHRDAPAPASESGTAPDGEGLRAAASRDEDGATPDAVPVVHAAHDAAEAIVPEFAEPEAPASRAASQAALLAPGEHSAEEAVPAAAADPAAAAGVPPSESVEEPSAGDPVADAGPAEFDGSADASPLSPQPEHHTIAPAPPSLAQGDRGLVKTRVSVPPHPARALDNDAPSAEARCRSIIMKAQLGEEASHVDRTYLRTACRARR